MFICFAFKNTGICSFLCISSLKNIGIYSIFCVFALLPQKTLKGKQCCNLQHFVNFEKLKIVRKMCQNGTFFPILGTLKTGGEFSWRRLWTTLIRSKKLSPSRVKDFWCFSGPGVGGSAAWGAPHHRALVALGRSWDKPLVWSRRSRICRCKGRRFMSLRKACGLVTCPLLFFTASPCLLLLSTPHCCFSEGSEFGRASTYLSLQGW